MKPLKLTIEGINSFVEPRTVDFESLSADGIFCICGPTGSGKTTILDCMILALYGENKNRGNLVDYINTKCDKGKIAFEFESDGVRYTVYREIRRKSATASKLTDSSNGEVIADRTDTVNEAIKKMLKLEKDEFTKVVILEQGRFARFMQMGGKDRSKTVAKLFSLEKYERLKETFAAAVRKYDGLIKNADSALVQYADYTEEKCAEKNREYKKLAKESERLKKEIAETENSVKLGEKLTESAKRREEAAKSVADAQAELKDVATRKEKLSAQAKELEADKLKLDSLKNESARAHVTIAKAEECVKDEQNKATKTIERDGLRDKLRTSKSAIDKLSNEIESYKKEKENNMSQVAGIMRDIASFGYEVKEGTEAEFAAIEAKAAADTASLKNASEKLEKAKAELARAESESVRLLTATTESNRNIKLLGERAQSAEKKYEGERTKSEAAAVRASLTAGDICPVCGGKYHDYKEENYADENTLAFLKDESDKAKKALDEAVTISKNLEVETSVNNDAKKKAAESVAEQEASLADKNADFSRSASKLARSGAESAKKASDAEKQLAEKESKLALEKAVAEKIIGDGKRLTAEIEEIEKRIAERLDGKSAQDSKAQAEKTIKEFESAQKEYEDKVSEITALKTELAKQEAAAKAKEEQNAKILSETSDEKFDSDAYLRLCESLESLKSQSAETDVRMGELNAQAKDMREKLDRKKELAAQKSKLRKKLDAVTELNSYTKGENELLAFVAEEYVQSFTAAASDTLRTLTRGKYTLIYESGDFYVEDFFAGGERRKVKTLSGGETFLASVSIAMAISREIAATRNYEFFFLDEGFGTLDERAIEMVTEALVALSRETTVGVITHRSELAERIGARLDVIPATEDGGSDVANVGV